MSSTFKIACVQNQANNDTDASLAECIELSRRAREQGAELICLPEFCAHLHVEGRTFDTAAAPEEGHPALETFCRLARDLGCWLSVGSIAVIDEEGHHRNRSLVFNDQGEITARYDKIHMFDVTLSDGEVYRESDTFRAGESLEIAETPFAKLGLSVCYDLRFAALYRLLAQNGAEILTVPAAFTHTTGKAHWHVLLRARAIETGCFVVAACQYGYHGKARTYGHSLIIDPWGEILAEAGEDQAVICATIDPEKVVQTRQRIPALEHDRALKFA